MRDESEAGEPAVEGLTDSASVGQQVGWRQRLLRLVYRLLPFVIVLAVVLRLTVRDSLDGIALFYYCTPLGVVIFLCGLGRLLAGRFARPRVVGCWTLAFLVATAWWLSTEWRWAGTAEAPRDSDLIVLFWNTARWKDQTRAAAFVNSVRADIVALVEAGHGDEFKRRFWMDHCPGYDVSLLGGGILVLVKQGTSGSTRAEALGDDSIYRGLPVHVRGIDVMLSVVDLCSAPHKSRREPIDRLQEVLGESRGQRQVVVGDFNTPADSALFKRMRTRYRLAFDEAGRGYANTWPVPLPVHQLDQLWVSEQLEVVDCRHLWTTVSDHRPVLATIRAKP